MRRQRALVCLKSYVDAVERLLASPIPPPPPSSPDVAMPQSELNGRAEELLTAMEALQSESLSPAAAAIAGEFGPPSTQERAPPKPTVEERAALLAHRQDLAQVRHVIVCRPSVEPL